MELCSVPRLLASGAKLLAAVTAIATATSLAGDDWWIISLFSHFRWQYLLIAAALCLVFCLLRSPIWILIAALCVGINMYSLAPFYLADSPAAHDSDRQQLRVVTLNVNEHNRDYNRVAEFLRGQEPDIVVLIEVTPEWIEGLGELRKIYPQVVDESRRNYFGIAILSRLAFNNVEVFDLLSNNIPTVIASTQFAGKTVKIAGLHFDWPLGNRAYSVQTRQFAAHTSLLRTIEEPLIVVGDFNTTPWSRNLKGLTTKTGLVDTALGAGMQNTWPAFFPPAGIPIDQCLISADLAVINRFVGNDVGSDHYPLVIDIGFRK